MVCHVCRWNCTQSRLCSLDDAWHPSALTPRLREALRAGVSGHSVDGHRLERVLRRVQAGQPITISAVGASLTADYAGAVGWMQDSFSNLGYIGLPKSCREDANCVVPGWMMPVADLLYRRFTRHHGADGETEGAWRQRGSNVLLVNAGIAGRPIEAFSSCLGSRLPAASDLIVVDAASHAQSPAHTEAVLRRLLALPHAPAVLLLHFPRWCEPLPGQGRSYAAEARAGTCFSPDRLLAANAAVNANATTTSGAFSNSVRVEAMLDELAAHYRLGSLSLRRAFFDAALNADSDPFFRPQQLTTDGLHPNRGARPEDERYMQLAAAMLAHYLWEAWQRTGFDGGHEDTRQVDGGHEDRRQVSGLGNGQISGHDSGSSLKARPIHVDTPNASASKIACDQESVTTRAAVASSTADDLPCPLHPSSGFFAPTNSTGTLEVCYGWDVGLAAPPGRTAAPLREGSSGWQYVEFDSHSSPDARLEACGQRPRSHSDRRGGERRVGTLATPVAGATLNDSLGMAGDSRGGDESEWNACVGRLRLKSKPGLAAFSRGSTAFIELSLGRSDHGQQNEFHRHRPRRDATTAAELTLTYLSSYEGMGMVRVGCAEGSCSCAGGQLDAHRSANDEHGDGKAKGRAAAWATGLVSVWSTARFELYLAQAEGPCVLRVEVLETTRSGGHKFKVAELAIARAAG